MENHHQTCTEYHELSIIAFDHKNVIQIHTLDEETGDTFGLQADSKCSGGALFSRLIQELHENCTTEELLITSYTWVMSTISVFHLVLGLELLEKTGLSKSLSPIIMSFFKYSLATVSSYSIWAADVHCRPFKISRWRKSPYSCLQGFAVPLVHLLSMIGEQHRKILCYITDITFMVCLGGFSGHGKRGCLVTYVLYTLLQVMMFPVLARIDLSSELLLVTPILTTLFRAASSDLQLFTFTPSVLCSLDKGIKKLIPVAVARVNNFSCTILKYKKIGKIVRYTVGLVGTIFFQNFFRLTTFNETKAFLYLATSWLAILTLTDAKEDFGIYNFLLGNMILGSTVNQSGLKSTTWFACGVCLLLYVVRINFKSVTSPKLEMMQRPPFIFWIFYVCTNFESLYCLVYRPLQ